MRSNLQNKSRKTCVAAVGRGKKKKKTHPHINPDINSTQFLYLELLLKKEKCIIKTMPLKLV